jgi:hypothetical protein
MTEYDPPSPVTLNGEDVLPWYYKWPTIVVGFLLCIWPGLLLLALRPPRSRKKTLIIVAVVVGILIVSALSDSDTDSGSDKARSTTTTPDPKFSYKDFLLAGVSVDDVWAPSCTSIKKVISTKEKKYLALITSGKKFSQNPYSANELTQKVSWWNSRTPFSEDVKNEVREIVVGTYPNFLSAEGLEAAKSDDGQSMSDEIDRDVIASCDLAASLTEVQSKASILALLRTSLQYSASNIPWYPKGYSEFEAGVAYRWLSSGQFSCSYSSGSCWGMSVRSELGCNSLYVEITIMDSQGNNIGYTNDTTSGLRPGQSAKMVFDSFEDNASSARLAKVSCY